MQKDFESIKKLDQNGVEYWEARELLPLLEYVQWRKFEGSIKRAKHACQRSGQSVKDHFAGADKMVEIGSRTVRKVPDYRLSRYACDLIAQNGDPRKPEIAHVCG